MTNLACLTKLEPRKPRQKVWHHWHETASAQPRAGGCLEGAGRARRQRPSRHEGLHPPPGSFLRGCDTPAACQLSSP